MDHSCTLPELSEISGASARAVYDYVKRGYIQPAIKIGCQRYYRDVGAIRVAEQAGQVAIKMNRLKMARGKIQTGGLREARRIAWYIRRAINDNRDSKSVYNMVGYTVKEFMLHMESLFTNGMSWKLFRSGKIHIDHVRPLCSFNLSDPTQIRESYQLNNLQPLWAVDNLRKGSK